MYQVKCSLSNIKRWRSCSGVPSGCVNRIRLWPLRRDDHSGVPIGAGGERCSDWPANVLANDVSTRIDRLHACRHKCQLATTRACSCMDTHVGGNGAIQISGNLFSVLFSLACVAFSREENVLTPPGDCLIIRPTQTGILIAHFPSDVPPSQGLYAVEQLNIPI